MRCRSWLLATAVLGLSAAAARSLASCQLQQFAQLPVTMNATQPLVHAKVNGEDALFIADSGAFFNLLTPAAAAQFNLHLSPAPFGFDVSGIGGDAAQTSIATVNTLTLLGVDIHKVQFFVAGNDFGAAVGLLGQNLFHIADVEYDLANGVIRLMRPKDCRNSPLAYWAKSVPYTVIDIESTTPQQPQTIGQALLNGTRIRVMFDSGASTSHLSLSAAKRVGVTPESPGAERIGIYYGVGRNTETAYVASFDSFKIGDEEIKNARLPFGGRLLLGVDMLIGADFFLSHRIYVASSQRKLYFTYNGGPVFNLRAPQAPAQEAAAPGSSAPAAAAAAAPAGESPAANPTDASAFSQRGAASASRHDYQHAIADFTRAIELAPDDSGYYYQRALAYLSSSQQNLGAADLDQALKLQPQNVAARIARAKQHLARKEEPAAVADLDAADRAMPKEAAGRLELGDLYLRAAQYPAAIAQFSDWIAVHPRADVMMVQALNLRCWTRALWGQELNQALEDCDGALRLDSHAPLLYRSRATVRLRQGEYVKAVADYDRELKSYPKDAWAHYGRGIAKLRLGLSAEGQADIDAATAAHADIATAAARHGLTP